MAKRPDFSVLDDAQLHQFVFFPRPDWTPVPQGASDHYVPVDGDVSVFGRFYLVKRETKNILYFHGNGEVACDYDWIAPLYNEIGINLFVADFRGYGISGGHPTFANTITDAHRIFEYFSNMRSKNNYTGAVYIMGRSLGSQSAIELAASYGSRIKGLILESGFLQNRRLIQSLGLPLEISNLDRFEAECIEQVRSITSPALIIHGELDDLIPHIESETIYDHIGSRDKKLVTIHGAGHNDIMVMGMDRYFKTIKDFIFLGG